LILGFMAFCSCKHFKSNVYFFASNLSSDKKDIHVSIGLAGDQVLDKIVRWTEHGSGIDFINSVKMFRGKYVIRVTADSGRVKLQKLISIKKDQYLFITYSSVKPVEEKKVKKKNSKQLMSTELAFVKPKLDVFVGDKPPSIND